MTARKVARRVNVQMQNLPKNWPGLTIDKAALDRIRTYMAASPVPEVPTMAPPPPEPVNREPASVEPDHVKSHASYLDPVINEADDMVRRFVDKMDEARVDYDTLIGTGLSGALAVPLLARKLGKRWAIIRKKGDGSHSCNLVEGTVGRRWLFVDDLVCTGETRERVLRAMRDFREQFGWETKFVGSYLYYHGRYHEPRGEG